SPIKVAFATGLGIGLFFRYSGRNIRDRAAGFASGVKERLTWRSVSFQLDGDFKKAMEDMLEKVSPFFANDNDLFSGLRRFMNCQTEMAWGDVRGLMEAVAPSLMAGYNNRQLKVANFFQRPLNFSRTPKKSGTN
ncbi:uncharacterized protein LOC128551901, partial [Mercenaria mercenaria]|uniref:uncharacterized protein LOC128551901 n=1 Tax=Mercenaria mercenaria TaxID=6596 RepID=UPI00234F7CC2